MSIGMIISIVLFIMQNSASLIQGRLIKEFLLAVSTATSKNKLTLIPRQKKWYICICARSALIPDSKHGDVIKSIIYVNWFIKRQYFSLANLSLLSFYFHVFPLLSFLFFLSFFFFLVGEGNYSVVDLHDIIWGLNIVWAGLYPYRDALSLPQYYAEYMFYTPSAS